MLTGILCIYIVLVLLFKDFLHPFTILTALPLSLSGAFVALLGTGMSFSMPSLIGLIMLMGIATKNSMLLMEYAIVVRRGTAKIGIKLASSTYGISASSYCFSELLGGVQFLADWELPKDPKRKPKCVICLVQSGHSNQLLRISFLVTIWSNRAPPIGQERSATNGRYRACPIDQIH